MILLLDFALIGLISGLLGIFYRNCLKSHMLYKLYWMLRKTAELPTDLEEEGFIPKTIDRLKASIAHSLGYCIYCSTFWITILVCILYISPCLEIEGWVWQDITLAIITAISVSHIVVLLACKWAKL